MISVSPDRNAHHSRLDVKNAHAKICDDNIGIGLLSTVEDILWLQVPMHDVVVVEVFHAAQYRATIISKNIQHFRPLIGESLRTERRV